MDIEEKKKSCTCWSCRSACSHKPGWFKPGEAEKVAEHLDVSLEELFSTKLQVDWWEADEDTETDIFVLSPAVLHGRPGEEFDADPNGTCVFFVEGRCSIHEVKPFECQEALGCEPTLPRVAHRGAAMAWVEHQDQIKDLLGREPQSSAYMGGSIFGMF
jgi:Fe-S-cluster containining protein